MESRKIDLALEAREWAAGAEDPPGVRWAEETLRGLTLTRVTVESRAGERALGKPRGTYLTLTLPDLPGDRASLLDAAEAVAVLIRELVPAEGPVLAAGLGNRRVTPDALGPRTAENLLVTRHLGSVLPGLRPVAALAPGVMGTTGMESGELVAAAAARLRPAGIVAVDALAARRQERVCRTIQISDAGIVPGSGVGNARMALTRATLGVPVIAVGVPTVVDAATLCLDLLEDRDGFDPSVFRREGAEWFVTPRCIDREVEVLARTLALGIGAGLQTGLTAEEVSALTEG